MSGARQRGVALLLVVALTAAVVAVVTTAQFRAALEVRRTTNLVFADQALAYHLGAEDWAGHLLRRDAEQDTVDDLTESWNQDGVVLPIEGGRMVGAIADLQGRFNVNNLIKADGTVDEVAFAQFKRLLDAVGVAETDRVAAAVVDWIDPDQDPRQPLGAEDSSYLRRDPPYRTADAPLRWVGELRLVEGIDAPTYALLAPQLAALPRGTAINVNTATLPVLRSLSDDGAGAALDDLLARQRDAPFASVPEFAAAYGRSIPNGIALDVKTSYFSLSTAVVIEGITSTMYSVLARASGGATHPLRRSTDPTP
jgi:general secretion pathway protein K